MSCPHEKILKSRGNFQGGTPKEAPLRARHAARPATSVCRHPLGQRCGAERQQTRSQKKPHELNSAGSLTTKKMLMHVLQERESMRRQRGHATRAAKTHASFLTAVGSAVRPLAKKATNIFHGRSQLGPGRSGAGAGQQAVHDGLGLLSAHLTLLTLRRRSGSRIGSVTAAPRLAGRRCRTRKPRKTRWQFIIHTQKKSSLRPQSKPTHRDQ